MTLLIDPTQPMPAIDPSTVALGPSLPKSPSPEIEQWVIEEARRRQRRRRLSIAFATTLAAAAATAIMGSVTTHRASSHGSGRSGSGSQNASVGGALRRLSDAGAARVFPALGAGQAGWKLEVSAPKGAGGGECCGTLAHEAEVREGSPDPHAKGRWDATVLAAPGVASVSVEGRKPVATHSAGLPYGLRFATLTVRNLNVKPVAYNAQGTPIHQPGQQTRSKSRRSERPISPQIWRSPATPPAGAPCQITATNASGLTPLEGAVISRVNSYRSLGSPAFQSCANTVYSLQGHTLDSAILLDAEHPGSRPASLPGMTQSSRTGIFQAPDGTGLLGLGPEATAAMSNEWQLRLSAQRVPGAWLVVAGGTSPQRRALLADLHARIHLTTPPTRR